jgi:hypothetical protein
LLNKFETYKKSSSFVHKDEVISQVSTNDSGKGGSNTISVRSKSQESEKIPSETFDEYRRCDTTKIRLNAD